MADVEFEDQNLGDEFEDGEEGEQVDAMDTDIKFDKLTPHQMNVRTLSSNQHLLILMSSGLVLVCCQRSEMVSFIFTFLLPSTALFGPLRVTLVRTLTLRNVMSPLGRKI